MLPSIYASTDPPKHVNGTHTIPDMWLWWNTVVWIPHMDFTVFFYTPKTLICTSLDHCLKTVSTLKRNSGQHNSLLLSLTEKCVTNGNIPCNAVLGKGGGGGRRGRQGEVEGKRERETVTETERYREREMTERKKKWKKRIRKKTAHQVQAPTPKTLQQQQRVRWGVK